MTAVNVPEMFCSNKQRETISKVKYVEVYVDAVCSELFFKSLLTDPNTTAPA